MAKGIVSRASSHSVDETVAKIQSLLLAKGITLFALIDHSGEAAKAGMVLRPTKLIIFGDPKAGTPLMQAKPCSALDLPLKLLVWEDTEQQVWISYNSDHYLQQRYSLSPELMRNIAGLTALAKHAAE